MNHQHLGTVHSQPVVNPQVNQDVGGHVLPVR